MHTTHTKTFYTMGNTGGMLVIDKVTDLTPVYIEQTETETLSFLSKL